MNTAGPSGDDESTWLGEAPSHVDPDEWMTRANVDPDECRHMALLGHNELTHQISTDASGGFDSFVIDDLDYFYEQIKFMKSYWLIRHRPDWEPILLCHCK